MEVFSGLLMGILGSFHCLGMCGPIAMAVPPRNPGRISAALDSLIYNLGRVLTYIILGALAGLLGASVSLAGYQETISIATGIILLIIVFVPARIEIMIAETSLISKFTNSIRKPFGKLLGRKTAGSLFLLGNLNGLLPCGLVYVALTASLAGGSVISSITFMLMFGLGTLPMMASVFVLKTIFPVRLRSNLRKLIPAGITIVALLLILRGMALGIPYISPVLPDNIKGHAKCCEQSNANETGTDAGSTNKTAKQGLIAPAQKPVNKDKCCEEKNVKKTSKHSCCDD